MYPIVALHTEDGVIIRTDFDGGIYPLDGEYNHTLIVHRIWDLEGMHESEFILNRVWNDTTQAWEAVPTRPNIYATWDRSLNPPAWTWDPENILQEIRFQRNELLGRTDWMLFVDSPLTEAQKADVMVYRQTLRDLPDTLDMSTITTINDVVWPTPPV